MTGRNTFKAYLYLLITQRTIDNRMFRHPKPINPHAMNTTRNRFDGTDAGELPDEDSIRTRAMA